MKPNHRQVFNKIRPFVSIATFLALLMGVGLLTLNLMFTLYLEMLC